MHDAVEKAQRILDDACEKTRWHENPDWREMISYLREWLSDERLKAHQEVYSEYLQRRTPKYMGHYDFEKMIDHSKRDQTTLSHRVPRTHPATPIRQRDELDLPPFSEDTFFNIHQRPRSPASDKVSSATISNLGDRTLKVLHDKVWFLNESRWHPVSCLHEKTHNSWMRYDRAQYLQLAIKELDANDRSLVSADELYASAVVGKCYVQFGPEHCPWTLNPEFFLTTFRDAPEICAGRALSAEIKILRNGLFDPEAPALYYSEMRKGEFSHSYPRPPIARRPISYDGGAPNLHVDEFKYTNPEQPSEPFVSMARQKSSYSTTSNRNGYRRHENLPSYQNDIHQGQLQEEEQFMAKDRFLGQLARGAHVETPSEAGRYISWHRIKDSNLPTQALLSFILLLIYHIWNQY